MTQNIVGGPKASQWLPRSISRIHNCSSFILHRDSLSPHHLSIRTVIIHFSHPTEDFYQTVMLFYVIF